MPDEAVNRLTVVANESYQRFVAQYQHEIAVEYQEEIEHRYGKSIDKLAVKNAHSHWGRVEDYLARERCDVVVVRAVSSVRENVRTLRKVRHSLKDLIMLKGSS